MSQPKRLREVEPDLVAFGQSFVHSPGFKLLFREGMNLVEEAAAYLDGDGREESRRLGRRPALAYAGESMRLTTRLMQIASWLLVQRAVSEGEITAHQAQREKKRVRLSPQDSTSAPQDYEALPSRIKALIERSSRMHARIIHLDGVMAAEDKAPAPPLNPVALQHGIIRAVFARG